MKSKIIYPFHHTATQCAYSVDNIQLQRGTPEGTSSAFSKSPGHLLFFWQQLV